MRKRLLAIIAASLIIMPIASQAINVNVSENIMPDNAIFSADLQLTAGKLKTFLEPLMREWMQDEQARPNNDSTATLRFLANKVLDGTRFFLSVYAPNETNSSTVNNAVAAAPGVFLSFPVSDAEWQTLINDSTRQSGALETYRKTNENVLLTKLGGFAVMDITASENPAFNRIIDIYNGSSTNSLTNNAGYQQMAGSYLTPHLLGATLNVQQLRESLGDLSAGGSALLSTSTSSGIININGSTTEFSETVSSPFNALNFLRMLNFESFSFAETGAGYKFNAKIVLDENAARQANFSINPGGSFTPALYTKFPNAKPIMYEEDFNFKAGFAQAKASMQQMGITDPESNLNIFDALEQRTNVDIEAIANVFDQEVAFAIQHDQNSIFPYFTLLANVRNNRAEATRLINDLAQTLSNALNQSQLPRNAYSQTREGGFIKFTLDIARFGSNPNDAPPFPQVTLTFGISDDDLMIISNYPNINDASRRTGFSADPDFSAYPEIRQQNAGVFYFNPRNVWAWYDNFLGWLNTISGGGQGPSLKFYQGYYSLLEKIYGWRDLFITTNSTNSEQTVTGFITIDQAQHRTYRQLLDEMMASDRDGDGVNDYNERFVYKTPVDSRDSDNDGITDINELRMGANPNGAGQLFTDVPPNTFYTEDVAFLRQRGAINGYSDRSFQPGRTVNRAEFVTMVMKAFEEQGYALGINLNLGGNGFVPFADVPQGTWFYNSVAKAYRNGFISGNMNSSGQLIFRPGDNITRAEALAILNRSSRVLSRTRETTQLCGSPTISPFNDVSSDDWFCGAVINGYNNGITRGKTPDSFRPFDLLNRAEAAVMIRRALEKDMEEMSSGTQTVGEMLGGSINVPLQMQNLLSL